jgi:hypothetical protein
MKHLQGPDPFDVARTRDLGVDLSRGCNPGIDGRQQRNGSRTQKHCNAVEPGMTHHQAHVLVDSWSGDAEARRWKWPVLFLVNVCDRRKL